VTGQSSDDMERIHPPTRQEETDSKREWRCPNCGHKEPRHHASKIRPFCDPCDWRLAVLVEMKPVEDGEVVDL
jgi:ribosomal protein L37AE/L43A